MIVGRFAPSPTGPLHLGSLVSAVGSWLFARASGGRWLMRMEDLDTPRVVSGMAHDILNTLETLGLYWDGDIMWQSARTGAYEEALATLCASGWAYPCACSRKEIESIASAPHFGDDGPVYPGTCRDGLPQGRQARSMRLKVEGEPIDFTDLVCGPRSYDLAKTSGDFVVRRADGAFAYQLAVVVDDAFCGVNQVVRGMDILGSTPRQIHLQRLLGLPTPEYAHLPLVTGPDGGKLSKRDNAVSLKAGFSLDKDAGRLLTFALDFLGQNPPVELAGEKSEAILAWASANFAPQNIPCAVTTLPPPAQPSDGEGQKQKL